MKKPKKIIFARIDEGLYTKLRKKAFNAGISSRATLELVLREYFKKAPRSKTN